MPATAEAQKDANACLRTSNALYKRGEELYKKRRWQFPAEFRRVASDLDQYCRDKEFKKADIAIDWLNTCLRNYDKQDNQGYCTRDKKYYCAIDVASEGLSHLETVWNFARKCRSDQCEAYGVEFAVPLIPAIGATVPAKAIYPRTSAVPRKLS